MKKRIVVFRNKYLDARRFHVQELAKAAELEPPYESINPKDTVIEGKLKSIADEFHVSVSCIATSLQKAKYVPSGKQKFSENDAYWISEEEVGSSNIKEARKEKARSLLEQGWPVNAVNEYTGLSFYALYGMSEEIEKSLGYLERGREGKVFSLWAKGLSQTDIANKLGITRQTVNSDLRKYKDAYISEHSVEDWKILEDDHNKKCKEKKKNKKLNYSKKADYAKKIVQKYINTDNGSLTKSIAGIEAEAKVNSKTVQKFVLLTLMENNLIDRAVEFANGIIGQPEIIKPALNLFAMKNEENDSSRAVKYLLKNRGLCDNKKEIKEYKISCKEGKEKT